MKVLSWRNFVSSCTVLVSFFFPFVAAAQVDYELLKKGVVKLTVQTTEGGRETGAGIVIGRTDNVVFVLTALHVVSKARAIEVEFFDKRHIAFPGKQIGPQLDVLDLAVVAVDPPSGKTIPDTFPSFTRGNVETLQIGAYVSPIGHPQGLDWQETVRANTLQRVNDPEESRLFRFTNQSIERGNSGGPVFDERGQLIGMVTHLAQAGHAVAVKIGAVLDQLKEWRVSTSQLTFGETPTPPSPVKASRSGMVFVTAGKFWRGCNEKVDTECEDDEKPGRTVALGAFQIDTTEVTVADYRRCVEAGQCTTDGVTMPYWGGQEEPDWAWACNWGKAGRDDYPINCVDWSQAKAYCEWAGKRLPTEAEWEKAARGADGRKYSWGNTGFAQAGKVANIADETAKKQQPTWEVAEGYDDGYYGTAPVGSFPAGESPFHALDLIGNVSEWTADWYDKEQKYRAVRGGSWPVRPRYARASNRLRYDPGNRDVFVGFRCAQ